ncbi:MAG: terminase small subunit [Steroidobacteraceae bacterium]
MSTHKPSTAERKRAKFVSAYCTSLNGTQAAIAAGYAPKSARITGSKLLTIPNIQRAIQEKLDAIAERADLTAERVTRELVRVAFADIRKLVDADGNLKAIHELTEDEQAQIASVETERRVLEGKDEEGKKTRGATVVVRIRRWDKLRALEICTEILGMRKGVDPSGVSSLAITIVPWKDPRKRRRRSGP